MVEEPLDGGLNGFELWSTTGRGETKRLFNIVVNHT